MTSSSTPLASDYFLAIQTISNQEFVPLSPGKFIKGKYLLCAGACLAAAGLESKFSKKIAQNFVEQVTKDKNSKRILSVFQKLGWNVTIAQEAIAYNDSLPEKERRSVILQFFKNPYKK